LIEEDKRIITITIGLRNSEGRKRGDRRKGMIRRHVSMRVQKKTVILT